MIPFNEIQAQALSLMEGLSFKSLALARIDFTTHQFESFEIGPKNSYFDLASLTKPLTLGFTYLSHPERFTPEMLLLLNHKGGLPMGGQLSRKTWKEHLRSFPVKESPTLYSDYSALRLMLELDEKVESEYWDPEIVFWKEIPKNAYCPPTGMREGRLIQGEVHDPLAYNLDVFTAHAGLFGTIGGVARTLIKADQLGKLINKMEKALKAAPMDQRFVQGWDRVQNPQESLAGSKSSVLTFGHLGFTGTSFWMDCTLKRGAIILTNATAKHWHDRGPLNHLRKILGEILFC